MSDHWTDRLSEYLDGDLAPAEREAAEAHLDRCETCARTLEELREVVARARSLDDPPPERDLWPGIAARLGERSGPDVVDLGARRAGRRRRFAFTLPQLVAASVALALISGGAVWMATGGPDGGPGTTAGAPVVPAPAATGVPGDAAARFATTRYDVAVRELEGVLEAHREALDPATVRVVERNLEIIDDAIAEARTALARDPASPYLNAHLAETMKRKIEILRRATMLAGARL